MDSLKSNEVVAGRNVKIDYTRNASVIHADVPESSGSGSSVRNYMLKEIGADWLRCREYDGTTESATDVYIARDFELRKTPFDTKTIAYSSDGDSFSATFAYSSNTKRTKTVSGVTENQAIVPYYKLNFTIIKGTETRNSTGVKDPDGKEIRIAEITSRAWAQVV